MLIADALYNFVEEAMCKPEKASTHKSAKTHAGNVFVTRDPDLRPCDPQNQWVSMTHLGTVLRRSMATWCSGSVVDLDQRG